MDWWGEIAKLALTHITHEPEKEVPPDLNQRKLINRKVRFLGSGTLI